MEWVTVGSVDEDHLSLLVERFGVGARHWASGLPQRLTAVAERWKITYTGVRRGGRTSAVYGCQRADGTACMLKVGPDAGLIAAEARMLRLWEESRRVPRVLEVDPSAGVLLQEAIEPGDTVFERGVVPDMGEVGDLLSELHEVRMTDRQIAQLRSLIGRIHFFYDHWEQRRAEGPAADRISLALLHRGFGRARALADSQETLVPLHGDLYPNHVLYGGPNRGLVAIDPQGCLGDPAFDAVDWALWKAESRDEVDRRVRVLAPRIGTTEERLLDVCTAMAPLLAVARCTYGDATEAHVRTLLELADVETCDY
ncbi:phosphotransferase [Spiractinospora alimapuensis]|uniref:aminoglycoside phosphotransferase family protein n=1 Tax=Spiractinospora alimapuensis TaxID=2820884 RepID=UPI001F17C0D5|nr:aminoglycoside phosphotransferase family protein [Spiractinospora alimapuensis]QVQ54276.1 phosphotransferase [Spiractinospora alimapuensis]